jgi:type VI secretion system protein ImpE
MKARDLYQAGELTQAIAAATDEVKQSPADTARRWFLCELLSFAGDLERVDRQLDTLGHQDPEAMVGVALFRQLVRAEQARQQFYSQGALPELLGEPTPALRQHLEASVCLREGKPADAMRLLARAEELRPKVTGTCDGQPFDDLRDGDDLTASFLEVLTSNGKYYWVPIERVELLELRPPARPRDLLWRRAHLVVRDGPDGEVYLPTLYAGSHAEADDKVRLGRVTDWRGGDGLPVRGLGLRTFLVGNEVRTLLDLKEIVVHSAGV